jgi:hypothetical protein
MRRTGFDSRRTNATKTVSDIFRHRNGTGKSYCRSKFDVGSERVKSKHKKKKKKCFLFPNTEIYFYFYFYFNKSKNKNKNILFQYISNKMQRCTVYFIWKLLYMFRVVPPPTIRSAYNCIYSIWYLSHRYCYLPLSWKRWNWFECAVGGVGQNAF